VPRQRQPRRLFWAALSAPAIVWLGLLFIVPFYAVLSVAGGQINEIIGTPVPEWNPLIWSRASYHAVFKEFSGTGAFLGPLVVRTAEYVGIAAVLALVIAYPAAYYVSRFAGRRKGILLGLLLAPFWVSYMMRMLAWIGLLQNDGYVNRALMDLHLISHPVVWLGKGSTVVLGLVYGYVPYLILVLYAGLDRIDGSLIEAGRDLGLTRIQTFLRVTLPLSRQAIITGLLITILPMLGDYFTNQMLSGTTNTTMIGNAIQGQLQSTTLQTQGASLSLLLLGVLVIPMLYYVIATNRASRANS
jgi:ABC-type spermidine/putrescine transport system permease subunit I